MIDFWHEGLVEVVRGYLLMKRYKIESYLVIETTTTVNHYEVLARNADEARDKVSLKPRGLEPVASDTQTIIDYAERLEQN